MRYKVEVGYMDFMFTDEAEALIFAKKAKVASIDNSSVTISLLDDYIETEADDE